MNHCQANAISKPQFAKFAGKYSRITRAGYKNTTELKPNGTYIDSTTRGGHLRVLGTGSYRVAKGKIIFRVTTGFEKGNTQIYPFDGRIIYPAPFKSASGKTVWMKEYERRKETSP